jgi:dipeptidyl aminopeptidase/acylaminoacyl peptidase
MFRTLIMLILSLVALPGQSWAVEERELNDGQLIVQDVPDIPPALVARLNQYQNVRSARFLEWTEDGKGMYIRTRFGDVNQIHRVDSPQGTRHQLTYFDEPIGEVDRQEHGPLLGFTMDRGGSENSQIFILDPATGISRMLTEGQSRNARIVWDRSGSRIAYQSTRRNGQSHDVWIMDPANPESATPVLEAPNGSWWAPVEFSKDNRQLLVQQYIGVRDSRIYLLDLETRALRQLAGDEDYPSANRATGFDAAGTGFYFITNSRGLSAELAWRSLQDGAAAEYISTAIPWDVTEFALSDDGRRGAFVTNEDGISRLHLLNTRTKRYSLISNMPVGLIGGLKFHPDNRRIAMTMNTARSPSDVFVLETGRSPQNARSLLRWTVSEVGGLNTDTFIEPELVRYPTFDMDKDQPLQIPAFVYRPRGDGPHPVIVYIHGGPESQYRPAFSSTFQMWLAELGVAVVAPNVRGSLGYGNAYLEMDNGFRREDSVKDIGALLDWIATQPDLDENRVAVYGGSYGGYMVLASSVYYSDRLKAAVDVVGISNFVTFLKNTEDYRRDLRRKEYGDERNPEMRAFLEKISPLNNVDKMSVPLLVVQGQNDPRVPVTESEQIVAALRQRGLPVWYMNALNEGHGYDKKENRDVYQQAAILFLRRYLLGIPPDPPL